MAILIFCCILWGWSFPVMPRASHILASHLSANPDSPRRHILLSPALLNALRFGLAWMIYVLITFRKQRLPRLTRNELLGGLAVGGSFGAAMILQVIGLAWARPSVSAFLTALSVLFTPLAQAGLLRRPVGRRIWQAVALALAGTVLLCWPNLSAAGTQALYVQPPVRLLGEMMTIIAAMFFTVQIIALDYFGGQGGHENSSGPAKPTNSARLTSVMLLTTALFSAAIAAIASIAGEGQINVLATASWGALSDAAFWWPMATLVLFSSVIALHLMNRYQPAISPAAASVIYCSEPVFAAGFSVLLGAERINLLTLSGGSIVLLAVILAGRKAGASYAK